MKLLTADIRKKMPGPRAQEDSSDPMVYAKFFHPWTQWTWFAYEAWGMVYIDDHYEEVSLSMLSPKTDGGPGEHYIYLPQNALGDTVPYFAYDVEDVIFFGLVYGDYTEYGSFSLAELWANNVERDRHFEPKPLSQVKEEMRKLGYGEF